MVSPLRLVWWSLLTAIANVAWAAATNSTEIFSWSWELPDQEVAALLAVHVAEQKTTAAATNTEFVVVVEKNNENVTRSSENSAFLVLCRNDEVYELLETIQSITDRYNGRFHHDWVFLNDEVFLDQLIIMVSLFVECGRLSFGQVPHEHWLYPLFIDQQVAAQKRAELKQKNVVYGDSESYRHMCRFYLGFFQHHPLIVPYDYYWRMEPGVRFFCDVEYDVFRFMRENNRHYGFVLSMFEYRDTIPLLWDTSAEYFASADVPEDNLVDFVRNPDGSYNLCHFWLNFEVASTEFFRSQAYQQYFDHLDRSGGFFYERWGDAPVHTLAVAHLLNANQVWWFEDIGYFHLPYLHCPQGPLYVKGRCSCDQSMDFSFGDLSCTLHFRNLAGNRATVEK